MKPEVSFFEAEEDEEKDRKYHGVYSGEVSPIPDPFLLGRIGVRMKSFDPLDQLAWCRVASPMAGLLHGTYFIPSIGDEVLIAFENGDIHSPIIIGSLHNVTHPPPVPSPLTQIRAIRSPLGNQLVFSEAGNVVALQSGPTPPVTLPAPPGPTMPYSSMILSPAGVMTTSPGAIVLSSATNILLQVGSSMLSITPAGVTITGAKVSVLAGTEASMTAPLIRLN